VRIDNGDDEAITLTAENGVYNSKIDHADLAGAVRIDNAKNLDLRMETAAVDFKAGVMSSDRPATLKLDKGEVSARSVEFSQKEQRATFVGDVHSVFYSADEDEASAAPTDSKRQ
jgi:lipopolysaccharide export system protein LptC